MERIWTQGLQRSYRKGQEMKDIGFFRDVNKAANSETNRERRIYKYQRPGYLDSDDIVNY